jgi:hypothetical protein
MRYFNKIYISAMFFAVLPFVASATEIFTTKEYVDETRVAVDQSTKDGSGNVTDTNENAIMQVNSSGALTRVQPVTTIDSTHTTSAVPVTEGAVVGYAEDKNNKITGASGDTISDSGNTGSTVKYPSVAAVEQYAIQKPATASAGKVLTYSGNADSRPVAQYVKVPMAASDPNTSGASAPTGYASIWLQ